MSPPALAACMHELYLFALTGMLFFGLDDLFFDCLWLRRLRQWRARSLSDLAAPTVVPRYAVWIPAWDEADVIGPVLRHMLTVWTAHANVVLLVGCYVNDPATRTIVAQVAKTDPRVRLVLNPSAGPTTKGDNLARLWAATLADPQAFDGIVLHDAEDVVDAEEIALFERLHSDFAMVQIPVRPFIDAGSPWIAGHYADEFAESHGKDMWLRAALGAAVPSAGVGTMIRTDALHLLAQRHGGLPFAPGSVTEDYEIGMRLAAAGYRATFARVRNRHGRIIAVGECFPADLGAAVRQKARWTLGIALAGWDRLADLPRGAPRWIGHWMHWRDRRGALAAFLLIAAYTTIILAAVVMAVDLIWAGGVGRFTTDDFEHHASCLMIFLLGWRLVFRVGFTAATYGWREGLRAVPRSIVGNLIAIMAVSRALCRYHRLWRGYPLMWDKTRHRLPPGLGQA